jgi:hypothetical protein
MLGAATMWQAGVQIEFRPILSSVFWIGRQDFRDERWTRDDGCRSRAFRVESFCVRLLAALFLVGWSQSASCAQVLDFGEYARGRQLDFMQYARAAEYCRGEVARPMALSADRRILCFDGIILRSQNYSAVVDLEEGGLVVVRSRGGELWAALWLASALAQKQPMIVLYDYCLSACADFLLLTSAQAVVLQNTLVAWHHPVGPYFCPYLVNAKDGGPKRLEKSVCPEASAESRRWEALRDQYAQAFYVTRIKPGLEMPPESAVVRRRLRRLFEKTGIYPDNLMWTWNPRYSARELKTRVIYERYPESQAEVDAIASKLMPLQVIYDP